MGNDDQSPKEPAPLLSGGRTGLSINRTALAADRTLLAWVRTSLSIMTFGFTIHKFFQYLADAGIARKGWSAVEPLFFGTTLVALSTVLLIAQTWQYHSLLKHLGEHKNILVRPTLAAAVVISGLGIAALILLEA